MINPFVTVVIPTYGDRRKWEPLVARAADSVPPKVAKIWFHGTSLSDARNSGAAQVRTPWLIFLDADDELSAGYIEAMVEGKGDVRWPSTLGVVDGVEDDYPVLLQPKPSFLIGNHVVIGSMVRRAHFEHVGGFRELPCIEDWDLFIRLALFGARFAPCPDAVYRVHVTPNSRNQQLETHGSTYSQIQQEYQAAWFSKFGGDESSMYEVP